MEKFVDSLWTKLIGSGIGTTFLLKLEGTNLLIVCIFIFTVLVMFRREIGACMVAKRFGVQRIESYEKTKNEFRVRYREGSERPVVKPANQLKLPHEKTLSASVQTITEEGISQETVNSLRSPQKPI